MSSFPTLRESVTPDWTVIRERACRAVGVPLPIGEPVLTETDERFLAALPVANGWIRVQPDVADPLRATLRTEGWAGVLRLPSGVVLRIEPRIAPLALVQLVAEVGGLVEPGGSVELTAGDTFLDVFGWLYASAWERVLRQGLAPRYVDRADDLPAVRGALDFGAIARRPGPRTTVPCTYAELTLDSPLNRAVLCAGRVLTGLASGERLRSRLQTLARRTGDGVSLAPIAAAEAERIRLGASEWHYASLLPLAVWCLRHLFYRDLAPDRTPALAFLVDMPALWEDCVEAWVRAWAAGRPGARVHTQRTTRDLLTPRGVASAVRLRPDVLVEVDDRPALVLDAKYKWSVSPDNVYQIVAYASALGCDGVLLLPQSGPSARLHRYDIRPLPPRRIAFVDLDVSPVTAGHPSFAARFAASLDRALAGA